METRTRTTDAVTDSRTGAAGRRWEVVRLLLGVVYVPHSILTWLVVVVVVAVVGTSLYSQRV